MMLVNGYHHHHLCPDYLDCFEESNDKYVYKCMYIFFNITRVNYFKLNFLKLPGSRLNDVW